MVLALSCATISSVVRAQEIPPDDIDPTTQRPSAQVDFGIRGVTSLNAVKSYGEPSVQTWKKS